MLAVGSRRAMAARPSLAAKRQAAGSGIDRNAAELARRQLNVLLLVSALFFALWLSLRVLAQADLWPLLAVPILLSAWFFFEAGALVSMALTGILLVQTSFPKNGAISVALVTFAALAVGLGWAQRRQKLVHRRTLRHSVTDALTGLYNYGHFIEVLDRELHRAQRYGGAVTLVMFDVDHFKLFNDRYGHQAGNQALKAVAGVLRRQKRGSDIAARFGGEEFVLLVPGGLQAGTDAADRLRDAIGAIDVRLPGGESAKVTVSVGVASYPEGASSKEELLARVDELLYTSKRSGRNRVSVAAPAGRMRLAVS